MLFRVGKVEVSKDILQDETITVRDLVDAFERYLNGDWGLVESEASLKNDIALTSGERILASYRSANGTKFYMTTEAGATRVLSQPGKQDLRIRCGCNGGSLQTDNDFV